MDWEVFFDVLAHEGYRGLLIQSFADEGLVIQFVSTTGTNTDAAYLSEFFKTNKAENQFRQALLQQRDSV